jgi:hypothetical protein
MSSIATIATQLAGQNEPTQGREPTLPAARTSLLVSLVVVGLAIAACGSSSSSSTSAAGGSGASSSTTPNVGRLPTVKFALHAGLAVGAFHPSIYTPLKNGTFTGGILKHKLALAKAGLAGLFAYHNLKLAIQDARGSPRLQKLAAPITALGDKLKSIGDSCGAAGDFCNLIAEESSPRRAVSRRRSRIQDARRCCSATGERQRRRACDVSLAAAGA